jgi:hypothetical protein
MAITILDVQQVAGSASSSYQTPAFATNPSNGDLIVVNVAIFAAGNPGCPHVPTDTAGNRYIQLGGFSKNIQQNVWQFAAYNITGGSSFKVTLTFETAVNFVVVIAWAITGIDVEPYNNDYSPNTGATSPAVSGTTPAPPVQSIFIGAVTDNGPNNNETDGSGWNTTGVNGFTAGMQTNARFGNFSGVNDLYTEYKISSSAEQATWTQGANSNYVATVASFSQSGGAPSGGNSDVPFGIF